MAARPTAPQNLSATAGNGQAVLTWVAPSSTGGTSLTGYTLTVTDTSVAGSTPQTFSFAPTTSYTASGLANGTPLSVAPLVYLTRSYTRKQQDAARIHYVTPAAGEVVAMPSPSNVVSRLPLTL